MSDRSAAHSSSPIPIIESAVKAGLDANILYEAVIELADEGFLTAGCINTAAGILVTELGLPGYFFRNISKEALKRVLSVIATNMRRERGRMVLRPELAEVELDVDGGVQFRIATAETRDRMEAVLDAVMSGHCIEYYFGREHNYFTYIIRPERCKELSELGEGESRFAFAQITDGAQIPSATRQRYEEFLSRAERRATPLIEVSASRPTRETRIMFIDDFSHSPLPAIRRMFEDLGMTLTRAYWQVYRGRNGLVESVCSLYADGAPAKARLERAVACLRGLLALGSNRLDALYVSGALTFEEFLFAACAGAFVHSFIYKDLDSDSDIMKVLERPDLRDAMAKRVFDSNRAEYTRKVVAETLAARPDLIQRLFRLFDRKFNPRFKTRPAAGALETEIKAFLAHLEIAFIDDTTGRDIFAFMARLIAHTRKTNFYRADKRAFSFRLDQGVLDPLVFPAKVHGIFFVVGFHAIGTHMRAEPVSRGGLRLIRVTPGNYETELDNMPLLNYALGPVAQRMKHKDIAESGAKGVIVPHVEYAPDGLAAVLDVTEGILDLVLPCEEVVDCLGEREMIFFGPDEGTAGFMDAVALRAKERGYKHWRTLTTGKTIGVPHDTYGLLEDRRVFGLLDREEKGTELWIEGRTELVTPDAAQIFDRIGGRIVASGMTTFGVMACFRAVLDHLGLKEEDVRLLMTGGPDGDLGANQIQSFKGRIIAIVDGGSVLFDPDGLDRKELMKLAFARHTAPRLNSLAYPAEKIGRRGFRVARNASSLRLPDGTRVEDGALFHRTFLANPANASFLTKAGINAFVPCGGFRNTIHAGNVRPFLANFPDLRAIVEGANVFFDDTARQVIAAETPILQIKDSSANKGGVTCSSLAEVLSAFLLGEQYEAVMVRDAQARAALIREVFDIVAANAVAETKALLALHEREAAPLHRLSARTSEQIFALQGRLQKEMAALLRLDDVVEAALRAYIPPTLIERLGMARVRRILSSAELAPYRDAILTKKLAALALYRFAAEWDAFLARLEEDFPGALRAAVGA